MVASAATQKPPPGREGAPPQDDGMWYPATVTAVVAPPSPATPAPDIGGDHEAIVARKEKENQIDIPPAEALLSDRQISLNTDVGGQAKQQEQEKEKEKEQEKLLEVTFLGYGNMATVPFDWAREIVTPETLQWCKDNGVEAWTKSASPDAEGDECHPESPTSLSGVVADSAQLVTVQSDHTGNGSDNGSVNEPGDTGGAGDEQDEQVAAGPEVQTKQQGKKAAGNKKKKRNKKRNKKGNNGRGKKQEGGSSKENEEEHEERFLMRCASRSKSPLAHVPDKYWGQRYRYFSKFDEGVAMDEEGWYSVTPEAIALHIAERVCCDVVVDPFVGCGGNAVQFALVCHLVFAIDLDPVKLEHARRNAAIYGVENRIEFILGDAMKVLPTLKADAVFLSPPWGGPEYSASATFDLDTMIPPPLSALDIFRAARQVTDNVVFFLPRNVDVDQVAGLPAAAAAADTVGDSAGDSARAEAEEGAEEGEEGDGLGVGAGVGEALENCELEKQFLNGKLKTTTAYFGRDIVAVRRDKRGAKNGAKNGAKSDAKNGGGEAWSEGNVPAAPPNSATTVEWNEGEQGGDGSSKGGRGAVWSGRHVRFSDDADTKGLTSGHEQDQQDQQDPVLNSRSRENALYESWMAAAATG